MHKSCFIIIIQINYNCYVNILSDISYNIYSLITVSFICKNNLKHIQLNQSHEIKEYKEFSNQVNIKISFFMNIKENYQEKIWAYKILKIHDYDIILRLLWFEH